MSQSSLNTLRLGASRLLARAVVDLFPKALLLGGEATPTGFYYDFLFSHALPRDFLSLIEQRMREEVKKSPEVRTLEMIPKNAAEFLEHLGHTFRAAQALEADSKTTLVALWQVGKFYDLCPGPHLDSFADLKAFQLQGVEEGEPDEKGRIQVRIYGTAFFDKAQLTAFLKRYAKAKKRDHRILGAEQELFSLPSKEQEGLWLPRGALLLEIILEWSWRALQVQGFQSVRALPLLEEQGEGWNPVRWHAYLAMKQGARAWPLRFSERGQIRSSEKPSEAEGLFALPVYERDRQTLFCLPHQVELELISSLHFIGKTIKIFQFNYKVVVALPSKESKKRPSSLKTFVSSIEQTLKALKLDYEIEPLKEGSSLLKVEVDIEDALGRGWQGPYLALQQGKESDFFVIERSVFGPLERFVGLLLENNGGQWPFWMAPEQVRLICLAKRHEKYGYELKDRLKQKGIRVRLDVSNEEKLAPKIHRAEKGRVPYIVVIGDQEEGHSEWLKVRSGGKQERMKLSAFLERLSEQIKQEY